MNDPKHLTDEGSEATAIERELLQAAQGVGLAPREKQAIWASVALQCAPVAASGVASASGSTVGAGVPSAAVSKLALGLTPLVKGLLIAVGLGGLSAGGYWLSRAPAAHVAAVAPAQAPTALASLPVLGPAPTATVLPNEVPAAATPAAAVSTNRHEALAVASSHETPANEKSALRDESAAVLEIRRTLRAGDSGSALRLLQQARERFPRGALSQEREALSIEALAKSGARAAAARRAQAFLHAYPKSPYASDVQTFATP